MDIVSFHFLISLSVSKGLDMRLMDVIIAYLYESIDNDIYIKSLKDLNRPKKIIQSLIIYAQSNYNNLNMD